MDAVPAYLLTSLPSLLRRFSPHYSTRYDGLLVVTTPGHHAASWPAWRAAAVTSLDAGRFGFNATLPYASHALPRTADASIHARHRCLTARFAACPHTFTHTATAYAPATRMALAGCVPLSGLPSHRAHRNSHAALCASSYQAAEPVLVACGLRIAATRHALVLLHFSCGAFAGLGLRWRRSVHTPALCRAPLQTAGFIYLYCW